MTTRKSWICPNCQKPFSGVNRVALQRKVTKHLDQSPKCRVLQ